MADLIPAGDWSPPLETVDIIERQGGIPGPVLRAVCEEFGVKARLEHGGFMEDFRRLLAGRGLSGQLVVLSMSGRRGGTKRRRHGIDLGDGGGYANDEHRRICGTGLMSPRELGRTARFRGRPVICLDPGLGTPEMAREIIGAGASAYISDEGGRPGHLAAALLFFSRFMFETGVVGTSVRDAWARAAGQTPRTGRFRLWLAGTRPGRRRGVERVSPERGSMQRARVATPTVGPAADWRPRTLTVDLVTAPSFPLPGADLIRLLLEQVGVKVNLFPCPTLEAMTSCLGGADLTAPVVLLMTHGGPDETGARGMIISSGLGKPRQLKVFGPDRIARARGLRGKLVIATGCDLLAPATCRAFLAARPQVCMITGGIGWSGTAFLIQFFHEMAVGGATVRKAWERARVANDETRRVALYTTDRPVPEPSTGRPRVLRGPALVEGFEGDTGNTFTGKWDSLFYRVLLGLGVPAPGGRPGLAFKLNYDFKRQPWPHLVIDPPPGGMRWASGRGLSLEVYVPHRLPSARPLRAVFMVFGSRWEYSVPKLEFRRGWQRIDLPFSAPIWRGRKPGTERWREDTFSLLRLGAFHSIWFGLDSTARRDRGSIYVDNIRLEA